MSRDLLVPATPALVDPGHGAIAAVPFGPNIQERPRPGWGSWMLRRSSRPLAGTDVVDVNSAGLWLFLPRPAAGDVTQALADAVTA